MNKNLSETPAQGGEATSNERQSTRPMPELRQFKVGSYTYGFIAGPCGYIVTEDDFCHQVRTLNENIELRSRFPWETNSDAPVFQTLTLDQIREMVQPIPSFRMWAHYWGIKWRVAANYNFFLKSLLEIGVNPRALPKWGDEVMSATPPQ